MEVSGYYHLSQDQNRQSSIVNRQLIYQPEARRGPLIFFISSATSMAVSTACS
jgi:hypothetical protein